MDSMVDTNNCNNFQIPIFNEGIEGGYIGFMSRLKIKDQKLEPKSKFKEKSKCVDG